MSGMNCNWNKISISFVHVNNTAKVSHFDFSSKKIVKMYQKIAKIVFFLALVEYSTAVICTSPTVKSTSFTTTDGKIVR